MGKDCCEAGADAVDDGDGPAPRGGKLVLRRVGMAGRMSEGSMMKCVDRA